MTAIIVLLSIALALLILIAYELRLLRREIAARGAFRETNREIRDVPTAGQTINVNLAPIPAVPAAPPQGASKAVEAETKADTEATGGNQGEKGDGEEERYPSGKREMPPARAVPSGLFAVKCPHCQAENSSYRSECFSCGRPL